MNDSVDPPVLDTLAAAKTVGELIAAHAQARKAVTRVRAKLGNLAQTYIRAMELWDGMKADGVPFSDRVDGLAKTLEAAWPKGRDESWKYRCASCGDYGLVMADCPGMRDATCERKKPHGAHSFGTPCWCANGARFKGKPKPSAEDFTQAVRSTPMTRLGRR